MNTSGFYDANGNWAAHFVYNANFELLVELKDTYTYPVGGWTWYDSVEEVQAAEGFEEQVVIDINGFVNGENNG